MTKDEVRRRITEIGIIPVVRASNSEQALLGAEAVRAGGIPIVEVTMTVPGAIEVIARLARTVGDSVLIGAGTVLDADAARECVAAGAQFIVSPGFDRETMEAVRSESKIMMAGALTPTEITAAWKGGADFIKIFPCGSVGGSKYIRALRGPFPQIPFVPTGGVNLETAADFIRAGAAALGIGSELVQAEALKSGNAEPIVENARKFVEAVKKARGAA
ncbi:MAG TPA: bifunctional 4-hydroxy-2-oxoglutarate aldolase/2-dehydro-3-deoxy-phosphogluconate aldolase [Candidatus Acidoferrales bacterium]|nr:bifunctional 4-hydroxy-2-oxoglutarate aldolase/2-dehydro-3-deoxy-phosphogluconate aldolase [Candidatus Acidoferrales bacterium]